MNTDSPALSATPRNPIPIWTDGLSLFTELPGPDARPLVLRYPLTTTGLSAALSLVRTRVYDYSGTPQPTGTPIEPTNQPGTPAQRDNARAILRRLGMLG